MDRIGDEEFPHANLTGKVIGCCIEVFREFGGGLPNRGIEVMSVEREGVLVHFLFPLSKGFKIFYPVHPAILLFFLFLIL